MRSRWISITAAILLLWTAAWLIVTRHAMLDDSLIHLRYAANLVHFHAVTFDGVHRTFGTSSPAYLVLLAALYSVWPSVFVPKTVSVVVYIVLLGVTAAGVLRPGATTLQRTLMLLMLASLGSVMGVRWLADGMESGLVCLCAVVLAMMSVAPENAPQTRVFGGVSALRYVLFGFFLTMLRLELLALCGICALALCLQTRFRARRTWTQAVRSALPLLLGGVCALVCVRLLFGSFLPDTALAKADGHPSLGYLKLFAQLLASSVALGVGSALLWLVSLILVLRHRTAGVLLPILAANSIFPLLMVLTCLRGQALQGVRYFIWAILFSTVWNILSLPAADAGTRTDWGLLTAVAVALVALLPVDVFYGSHTLLGRAHTFDVMRSDGLNAMEGRRLFADDIGFISYFTQADVCDLNGLVNGRKFATLTQHERIRACVARQPDAMFLTTSRVQTLPSYGVPLDREWVACERIDFPNVSSRDTHYLLARRELAAQLCPAADTPVGVRDLAKLQPR